MEKVKQNLKNNFLRYPVSGIYMLLAMLLTFIALFKGVELYNKLMAGVEDQHKYGYIYEAKVTINELNEDMTYEELFKGVSSNAYVETNMGMDEENASYRMKIYFNIDDIKLAFLEGTMPSNAGVETGTAAIVIGQHHKQYSKVLNGKRYISINGEDYLVTGIVGNKNSDYFDYLLITEFQYLTNEAKKQLSTDFASDISIQSDNGLGKDKDVIINNAKKMNIDVSVTEVYSNGDAYNDDGLTSMYTFMYVFCLINCIIASEFFVWERYDEIIIRKAYGFRNIDIFNILFKDVLKLSAVAGSLGMMINIVINYFEYGFDKMLSNMSVEYLAMSLFMVLLSCIVISMLPLYKMSKIMPAQLLK